MKIKYNIIILLILFSIQTLFIKEISAQYLKVSINNRFLVNEDGTPFFWLGDTAWELFLKLDKKDTEFYLKDRANKEFNVIQCVLTGGGNPKDLKKPNQEGNQVFVDMNLLKPNEKYFEHVDWVIDKAKDYGIYMAILPAWGTLVVGENHVFDKETAFKYGLYIGERYKDKSNIIWVLGGDKTPKGCEQVWDNMARGIKEGGSNNIMSYHPGGEQKSSLYLHNKKWLDFNMIQSGHLVPFYDNYRIISEDYNKTPVKPVIDAEMIYEDMPFSFCPTNDRVNDFHIRVGAYWSVFAGAFGVTYGSNGIFNFYRGGNEWSWWTTKTWKEAMQSPGSFQMRYLKKLMLSRPFLSRIPDQSIVRSTSKPDREHIMDHLQATRDGSPGRKDASYIMIYYRYLTHQYNILTDVIPAKKLHIWWYNPRTGESFDKGEIENKGIFGLPWGSEIKTDNSGPDWVLVIDDASKNYPPPGE